MFKAMDTDNSGAITFDELKDGLKRYGSTLKDADIRDLMEAVSHFAYSNFDQTWPSVKTPLESLALLTMSD